MRSALLPIFLIVLVDVLALTIILPLLPFYAERLGATPTVAGLLVSTFAACQLLSGPVLGQLSDRYGRKSMLVLSQIGTLIGFLLIARAESLAMVFAGRILDGLTAGNLSLAQAYIADVTAPENRARAFGVIGIAFGIGFLIGPAISGYLAHYNYAWPLYAAAALSATSIVATMTLLSNNPTPDPSTLGADVKVSVPPPPGGQRLGILEWGKYRELFGRATLKSLFARFFLFSMSFGMFTSGFGLFAERRFVNAAGHGWGPREVGFVFAYGGFLGIFLQGGIIGRLVKRYGEAPLVTAGLTCLGLGFVALGLSRAVPLLMVSATLSAFGNSALRPALTSLVTRRVARHEQGLALGFVQSLTSLASIMAPALGGFLIGHGWLSTWGFVAAAAAFVGLLVTDPAPEAATP